MAKKRQRAKRGQQAGMPSRRGPGRAPGDAQRDAHSGDHGPIATTPPGIAARLRDMACRHPAALPALAIALLIVASYAPLFSADYIWDDKIFQEEAACVQAPLGVIDIWLNPRCIKNEAHYWPLVYSSFWLEYQLWGFNPLGSRVVNLLAHLCVCLLLWRLLMRLRLPGAWVAAAVFALHPVHVEAVAWAIARKDLFASVFYLLGFHCYLRFRERAASRDYIALLALFTAGMLAKSLVITLPATLLVWVWWRHGRIEARDFMQTLPLFGLGVAMAAGDLSFYHARAVIDFDYAWAERPIIAAKALWFYLGKLLWPHPLIPVYPKWDVDPANWLNWLPLVAAVALALSLWFARRVTGRAPLAGVLLFAIVLSPTLGLGINVFMLFAFAADRYQYLASAALITLFASTAVVLHRRFCAHRAIASAAKAALLLLLLGYGVLTFRQTLVYQDDAAFWQHIVEQNPKAHSGYYNLGLALVDKGQVQAGIDAYRHALALGDESAGTYINLSYALLQLEQYEQAAEIARRATKADPKALLAHQNLASALHKLERYEETLAALQAVAALMKKPTAEHQYHLGHIAGLLGRTEQAERYLLQSLQLQPNYTEARRELLFTYLKAGRYDKARKLDPNAAQSLARIAAGLFNDGRLEQALTHYRYAIGIAPHDADAHVNMGATLTRLGRVDDAMQSYQQALRLDPDHGQGLAQLAYTHFNAARYTQALPLYRRLATLEPANAKAHVNVGMALSRLQRPQEAQAAFNRALEIEPQQPDALAQLAALHFTARRYTQALAIYRRMVTATPDNADAHANLGSALAQSGRLPEAVESYARALQLNPQLPAARVNIKLACERLEEPVPVCAEHAR